MRVRERVRARERESERESESEKEREEQGDVEVRCGPAVHVPDFHRAETLHTIISMTTLQDV